MAESSSPRAVSLVLGIAGFALVGAPLLAYVWESLNQLLAGHVDGRRLLITVPVAAVLVVVWKLAARWAARQGGAVASAGKGGTP